MDDDRWRERFKSSTAGSAATLVEDTETTATGDPGKYGVSRKKWVFLLIVLSLAAVALVAGLIVGITAMRSGSFALSFADVSTDEPGTWTLLPLSGNGGNVNSLAIDSNNPDVVYAATENGVFKSVDGAGSWKQIMKGGRGMMAPEVFVLPGVTPTLFVTNTSLLSGEALMRSIDGGTSWENLSWGGLVPIGWNMQTIRWLDLGSGPFMYVSCSIESGSTEAVTDDNTSIWCSYDKGDTWIEATGTDRQKIEAARDASKDWAEPVDPETGAKLLSFIPPVYDPSDASVVYAGTQGGVYKSVDGGVTWARTSEGLAAPAVAGLVFDPVDPAVIYATTEQGVSKSTDAGQTWNVVLEGGPADPLSAGPSLVVAPSSPRTLYAWTVAGLFRSDDGGGCWSALPAQGLLPAGADFGAGLSAQLGPVASGDANVVLASGNSGVFRTTDGGKNWSQVLGEAGTTAIAQMERDPNAASTVYASLAQIGLKAGAEATIAEAAEDDGENDLTGLMELKLSVLKSTDDGAMWSQLAPDYFTGIVVDFDVDPRDPSVLYAIHSVSDTLSGPFTLSRSRDGGRTWERLSVDADKRHSLSQLVLDPRTKGTLYVLTSALMLGTRIYRSTDSGASWSDITGDRAGENVTKLYIDPATEAGLYVTSAKGLYRWTPDSE